MMPPGSRFMARAPLRGRTVIMMAPGAAAAMERRRFAATVLRPVTLAAPVTGSARAETAVRQDQACGVETAVKPAGRRRRYRTPVSGPQAARTVPQPFPRGRAYASPAPQSPQYRRTAPMAGSRRLSGVLRRRNPTTAERAGSKGRHMPQCAQLPPPNPPCGASL